MQHDLFDLARGVEILGTISVVIIAATLAQAFYLVGTNVIRRKKYHKVETEIVNDILSTRLRHQYASSRRVTVALSQIIEESLKEGPDGVKPSDPFDRMMWEVFVQYMSDVDFRRALRTFIENEMDRHRVRKPECYRSLMRVNDLILSWDESARSNTSFLETGGDSPNTRSVRAEQGKIGVFKRRLSRFVEDVGRAIDAVAADVKVREPVQTTSLI